MHIMDEDELCESRFNNHFVSQFLVCKLGYYMRYFLFFWFKKVLVSAIVLFVRVGSLRGYYYLCLGSVLEFSYLFICHLTC